MEASTRRTMVYARLIPAVEAEKAILWANVIASTQSAKGLKGIISQLRQMKWQALGRKPKPMPTTLPTGEKIPDFGQGESARALASWWADPFMRSQMSFAEKLPEVGEMVSGKFDVLTVDEPFSGPDSPG